MSENKYRADLTLDDFDDMMNDAAGKPRSAPKLTSYGPVDPSLANPNTPYRPNYGGMGTPGWTRPLSAPPVPQPRPVFTQAVAPLPVYQQVMVPQPVYYPVHDAMPRHSAAIHTLLFLTTGGVGNVFYGLYVMGKKEAWRQRHGL